MLPILHLNGYKISNPTILARIEHEELEKFFEGCGWTPLFVEGDEPEVMHRLMAATVEEAIGQIHAIQKNARENNDATRPLWPMIVLRSPKGWTGPKDVDGLQERRHLPRAPGADSRRRQASRSRKAAGKLDEELSRGRTLRRERDA